jgi:hypothetical protein
MEASTPARNSEMSSDLKRLKAKYEALTVSDEER